MTLKPYNYRDSVKSDVSDELVNVYLQRPIAGLVTRLAYSSSVTPNQLTIAATVFGLLGSFFLLLSGPHFTAAAIFLYLKDLFDSADGQLARAKQLFSRRGRFLDSVGDFAVNAALFAAIFVLLVRRQAPPLLALLLALVGFLGVTLRVSYHVFYQTSFLHSRREYQTNRLSEEFRPGDFGEDITTVRLQKIFLCLYGWQDRLVKFIDLWSRGTSERASAAALTRWYSDTAALRLSGFLGLGTEFVLLTACLLFHNIEAYLFASIGVLNCVWATAIVSRRFVLAKKIEWRKE
jgi:phosphatidylglycerophosphate synthase